MKDFGRLQPHVDAMVKAINLGYAHGKGYVKPTPPLPNAVVVGGRVQGYRRGSYLGMTPQMRSYHTRNLLFLSEIQALQNLIQAMPWLNRRPR